MKSLLHIFLFFFLLSQQHYTQWTNQNPIPNGNQLRSVFFIDDYTGWIVGSDGLITKTTNSGLDWIEENSPSTTYLKAVKFVDNNIGWVVGDSGLILTTTNGGSDWTVQTSGISENLNSVDFYNANIGWVVGHNGTILKTTDGGSNWNSIVSGTTYHLFSVYFIDAITGWAVGGNVVYQKLLLKTTDGGNTWFPLQVTTDNNIRGPFYSVYFINPDVGWIGGTSNTIFKTLNGGTTWYRQSPILEFPDSTSENITGHFIDGIGGNMSVFFKDEYMGWISGGGCNRDFQYPKILSTTDSGSTWYQNYDGVQRDQWLASIFVTPGGKGWAVGQNGRIFISDDNGVTWNRQLSGGHYTTIKSLFCINESTGYAIGYFYDEDHTDYTSVIMKTTNSGKIWESKFSGPTFDQNGDYPKDCIFFLDTLNGWVAETNVYSTYLFHTNDGGESWSEINSGLGECTSLYFISTNVGWASTVDGIAKTNDGGITWVTKSTTGGSSIYFSDANNGWVVGDDIRKSTDGGETWITKSTIGGKSIKFINSNVGICVGAEGTVLLSTDGGETWISKDSGTSESLNSVSFVNSTSAWIGGNNGIILQTTDLGNNWTLYEGVTENNINTIFFVNENTGWFSEYNYSNGGTIFKYYKQPTAPLSPTNLTASADTFSVELNWTDNSDNETGFVLERKDGDSLSVIPYVGIDTVLTDMTSAIDTELTYNTTYTYRVFSYNNIGNSDYSNLKQVTTLNVAPSSPTNLTAVADTFSVELDWIDNSDNETGFVIERKEGDTLSVIPYVGIDTVSSDMTSAIDTGLTYNTTYTYRVFAYNIIGNSDYSNLRQVTTISLPLTFQLTVSYLDGWNIVSIPGLHPLNQNVSTWWSGKDPSSGVFKFNGSYQSVSTVELRTGYWMKNLGEQTYSTGDEWPANGILVVSNDAISANAGWNLIGGYEYNAAVSGITTTPPGLQNSPVYKYSGGYQVADYIIPGYGYWIKLSGSGLINLPEQTSKSTEKMADYIMDDWGRIVLTDAVGRNYTLYTVKGEVDLSQYELPPIPPAGIFDIRFSSGRIAENINESVKTIDMSGVTYPFTVRVEGMDMRLMDETGKIVNINLKSDEDIVINDATIQKLMVTVELIPAEYSLEQNYPNPFNPSTVIEFSLPEDVGNVKLSIYNALGEKIAELVNTSLVAGKYSYQWNAQNVATGMYIYELRTDKFVSVKKMVLMK